jgi:hypothetical protein
MTRRPGTSWRGFTRLSGALFAIAGLGLSGCLILAGRPIPYGLVRVELLRPIQIPAGRAHAKFQGGGQVRAVNRYEPWCDLETQTVAEEPQRVDPTGVVVGRIEQAFIRDYNTREPALLGGLSCDDLVFKETTWWISADADSPVLYLRCYAPYVNCRFGPPLSPLQIQEVLGPRIEVRVGEPL